MAEPVLMDITVCRQQHQEQTSGTKWTTLTRGIMLARNRKNSHNIRCGITAHQHQHSTNSTGKPRNKTKRNNDNNHHNHSQNHDPEPKT